MDWVKDNLALLTGEYPKLEHRRDGGVDWVRIPDFPLPAGVWTLNQADVAFRIPQLAGEAPYGFWVRPGLALAEGGAIGNYSFPATTPWGNDWGQFSLAPVGQWQPRADVPAGANMLRFARGVADRLREGA
jgi:hypothetical protein